MTAKIFVKYPVSFYGWVTKDQIREGIEESDATLLTAISKLSEDKQARVFAGEKVVVRVKVGTRTKLIKWRFKS